MSRADEILEDVLGPEPNWGPVWHCFNCGRVTGSQLKDWRYICTACIEIDRQAHDLFDQLVEVAK